MPFTTVLFDFGGVITSSPFEAFNTMEAERGLPQDFVRRVNSVNPDENAWAKFERAEIDAAQFDIEFAQEAAALGHALEGSAVLARLAGEVRPYMVRALYRLKAQNYRLGCITNNMRAGRGPGMSRTESGSVAIREAMNRFEVIIESSKAGVRKPDPKIYRLACAALGVEPADCVYLDDLGINCKPAAAMGMHAIKVTSGEQALADLEAVLGLGLR